MKCQSCDLKEQGIIFDNAVVIHSVQILIVYLIHRHLRKEQNIKQITVSREEY